MASVSEVYRMLDDFSAALVNARTQLTQGKERIANARLKLMNAPSEYSDEISTVGAFPADAYGAYAKDMVAKFDAERLQLIDVIRAVEDVIEAKL